MPMHLPHGFSFPELKQIILNSHPSSWSLQGMGMFRLYLAKEWRLHLWDDRFKVPNVTMIHDHPWDFDSYIVKGKITNTVYCKELFDYPWSHNEQSIKCGPGGGLCSDLQTPVALRIARQQTFYPGECYSEKAEEIHETKYERGTVTLIRRHFREDTEHAHVYPEFDKEWVSAEPRPATGTEITEALTSFLLQHLL